MEEPGRLQSMGTRLHFHFHFSLSHNGEGNGNPLQCSCLENPRDGRAWWAALYGVTQSRTWLKRLSSSSSSISSIMWNDMIFSHTDEVTTLELTTCVSRVSDPCTPLSQLRMLLMIACCFLPSHKENSRIEYMRTKSLIYQKVRGSQTSPESQCISLKGRTGIMLSIS